MIRLESKTPLGRLIRTTTVASLVAAFVLMPIHGVKALTYASIGRTLDLGAQGVDVSNLQRFLASHPTIYPEGTVSGYFGPLTQKAVAQFQFYYNLSQVGRVGPLTLQKINSLILADRGMDINAPFIRNISVSTTNSSATISWTTDELASAKAYYSTAPLQTSDTDMAFSAPNVSGNVYAPDVTLRTSHGLTLSNLSPSTTYYYLVQATDQAGNVSVYWNTFRTN
jgi:peptidoglycan hydrolase-like protein with peptidoglycan-binding domain